MEGSINSGMDERVKHNAEGYIHIICELYFSTRESDHICTNL